MRNNEENTNSVAKSKDLNVLGGLLEACCYNPMTGFFRDGFCRTDAQDRGIHTVCVILTEDFLAFSKSAGNDLSTPIPAFGFEGLNPGDMWCLCASRWVEAYKAGRAPKVKLTATHAETLALVSLETLKKFAVDVL